MAQLTIDDGFESNLKSALEQYFEGHDINDESTEDLLKTFDEGYDDDFMKTLIEVAHEYIDINDLAKKVIEELRG